MPVKIHVIAPCPPPVTGMTIASKAVADSLGARARIHAFSKSNRTGSWQWSVTRQVVCTSMMLKAAFNSRGRMNVYWVPSSSIGGLIADTVRALLLRVAFRRVWLHHHVSSYCNKKNPLMTILLKILSSKARHVVLNATMANKLEVLYGAKYFFVLNNASLVQRGADITLDKRKPLTVGFLGNLTREKGVIEALATMRTISELHSDLSFLIAGPLVDAEVSESLDAFVSCDPVRRKHLGLVTGTEKQAFYQDVDILLFPTKYKNEAQPLTIYEGLANGCVVLATPFGGIPEQLAGLNTCFESEDYLSKSVELISEWIDQPEKLNAAQIAARDQFERHRKISEKQLIELEDALCSQS